ncbi:phosphoribosylformylglycinamidine synthase, partial [Candidatus Thiomargarita nelsonii]
QALCERERCPYAVVGKTTRAQNLHLFDDDNTLLIDMPLSVLLGKPPKMRREVEHKKIPTKPENLGEISIKEAALRVLHLPTVANKNFLITIGDRSVGGLVVRDQMLGPWQVPVADCAVTASNYDSLTGEAMAIGERSPLALLNAPASGRMAIGEALTNIAAADISYINDIVLSANWMAACGQPGEDAALFDTVKAVAMELCPALGINIPVDLHVGEDIRLRYQANSEHCRHKIFNAEWIIDGQAQDKSLFQMIRFTHQQHPGAVISAYHDNAAVMKGFNTTRFLPDTTTHQYYYIKEDAAILMKVETHNHPTAISPFPGAATGAGGEIRDEGATGRGAKPKAGLTGFSVSHLRIPDAPQPWETPYDSPSRMATALQIMLEGPIGASAFNNEFGRPAICGYFRTFEIEMNGRRRGYHKPIMLAGGTGNIRPQHIQKQKIPPDSLLIILGGPAMLIGLGGGAASSMAAGHSSEDLDFASVQRGNPEMQRRCQEVIDACWRMGADNPIISIHDVGAGGLSNALPELVNDSGCGGQFKLSAIPTADPSLSPMEIWCNEAQE